MKTTLKTFFLFMSMSFLLTGCDFVLDSIGEKKTEETKGNPQDTKSLVSPDLKLYELAGNVKEVKFFTDEEISYTLQFDQNGTATAHKNFNNGEVKTKRDKSGKVIQYMCNADGLDLTENYSYDNNGYLSTVSILDNDILSKEEIRYNDKKHISEVKVNSDGFDNELVTIKNYEYISFDKNGNWTERKVKESIEHEDVNYQTITEKREISYY